MATWAGAAVAAGLVGYGAVRFVRSRKPKFELPQPPQGTGQPVPLACELGPNYPGFEQDSTGACVPTDATPPGIYVDVECTDFVYIGGDDGPMPRDLDKTISSLAIITKDPTVRAADPTYNVTQFFQKYWPDCPWPPVGGTPRLQQLFIALSLLLGREIVHRGGRVLGTATTSQDEIDERVATRLIQLGMPMFDPSIVPEIVLPDYDTDVIPGEAQPPGPGPDIQEPPPPQGGIDLPPGGAPMPGDFPPKPPTTVYPVDIPPPVLKHCQEVPYTKSSALIDLDPAWFYDTPGSKDLLLFDFDIADFSECKVWNLRFGICLRPTGGSIYGLFNPDTPMPDNPIHLRNTDGAGLTWSQFTVHPVWKHQFSAIMGLANTTGLAVAGELKVISDPGVDPCPNDNYVWPTPSQHHFLVTADHGAEPRFRETEWQPRPSVQLVTAGRKVYARLRYFGMPRFYMVGADPQWGGIDAPGETEGHLVSKATDKTSFETEFKVWALGAS